MSAEHCSSGVPESSQEERQLQTLQSVDFRDYPYGIYVKQTSMRRMLAGLEPHESVMKAGYLQSDIQVGYSVRCYAVPELQSRDAHYESTSRVKEIRRDVADGRTYVQTESRGNWYEITSRQETLFDIQYPTFRRRMRYLVQGLLTGTAIGTLGGVVISEFPTSKALGTALQKADPDSKEGLENAARAFNEESWLFDVHMPEPVHDPNIR